MSSEAIVHTCFEKVTGTWQYIVADPATRVAAIIDSVLDFDPASNSITTTSADALLDIVKSESYNVEHILETHAHADHLTAAQYLKNKMSEMSGKEPKVGIGHRIVGVQQRFANTYEVPEIEYASAFDITFQDDHVIPLGQLSIKVFAAPGHTPDHVAYHIGNCVFAGDSIFNSDVGSARCDFPGGSAETLHATMIKLLALPGETRLYTGHDYPPGGEGRKEPLAYTTVAEQAANNKHVKTGTNRDDFIKWRSERDSQLNAPRLIHQALQWNIRAGKPPAADANGMRFFHVPIKLPSGF